MFSNIAGQPSAKRQLMRAFAACVVMGAVAALFWVGQFSALPWWNNWRKVRAVGQGLHSPDVATRVAAASDLAQLGWRATSAVHALTQALRDPDPSVRDAAASALQAIGAGGVPEMLDLLEDPDQAVRGRAVRIIGSSAGPESVPELIRLLRADTAEVREAAAQAITWMGPKAEAALPALMDVLRDEKVVNSYAVIAVGSLGGKAKAAVPELMRLVIGDDLLRRPAAVALGNMGFWISDQTDTFTDALGHENAEVRCAAAEIIGWIDSPKPVHAIPHLIAALNDSDVRVRIKATLSLGNIGAWAPDVALPGLALALQDRDTNVKLMACKAIWLVRKTLCWTEPALSQVIPLLTELLKDDQPEVRKAASEAAQLIAPGDTSNSKQ